MSTRSYTIILIFIFLTFSVSAYLIVGNLHHDEHFQLLEFANFKRGLVDSKYLPWEFAARLRPAIQPTIAVILIGIFESLNVSDPFTQAFLLRLISSALFIICSFQLYKALEPDFKSTFFKFAYFALTFYLYIFPLTGIRFSSENWSSCFYVLGFAYLYPYVKKQGQLKITASVALISGILFGLSFLFRYQSAIMIFGFALWLLAFHLKLFRYWATMFAGFLFIVVLGILIDRWFYGEWAITAWNYFHVNLMEGKAAMFGVEPWWWYLSRIDFSKWMIILNAAILFLIVLFALVKFRHPVTWIFFPFLIAHFLIAHKETRFLYPILVFIPFMVMSAIQFLDEKINSRILLAAVLIPLTVINCFAFGATSFTIHDNSAEIWKYIRTLPKKPILIYYDEARFFYTLNDGVKDITLRFYKDDHRVAIRKKSNSFLATIPQQKAGSDTLSFVILNIQEQEKVDSQLQMVFDPEPAFVKVVDYRNWMRLGSSRWKVYQLK
jgi:phosphatidylinositol glycan class B